MIVIWLGLFVSFGLSALFSLLEAVLSNLTPLRIRQIKTQEAASATRMLDAWLNDKEKIEDALIFCNSFLLVVGCLLVYREIPTRASGGLAFVLSFLITVLFVLCCKVIPRALAKRISQNLVVSFLRPFRIVFLALLPMIVFIEWIGAGVSRLLPAQSNETTPQITEADLAFLIQVGEEEGVLADEKHEMLSGVFELADTRVREIMVRWDEIKSLSMDAKLSDVLELSKNSGFSRIPIYEGRVDKVLGYVHAKDILTAIVSKTGELDTPIRDLFPQLKRVTLFAPDSKPLDKLFQEMRRHRSHMAMVLDEYGSGVGLVTMEDILEEIVGEVRDEFDQEEDTIRAGERLGEFIVESKVHIEDFCDSFHVEASLRQRIEKDRVIDTLSGLILQRFGRIPKNGEKMIFGHLEIEILEVSKRRVRRVIVRVLSSGNS
jgi:putative hemolysin